MSFLRWILVIAGLVLLAAIYVLGRRRHGNPSDKPALEPASRHPARGFEFDGPRLEGTKLDGTRAGGPRIDSLAAALDDDVPQLEQAVRTRARVEPPMSVTRKDVDNLSENLDDLPPMHAGYSDTGATLSLRSRVSVEQEASLHDTRLREPSLGAFSVDTGKSPQQVRDEPGMESEPSVDEITPATPSVERLPQAMTRPQKKSTSNRKIVALRLSAASERVDGAKLKILLESAGLRHGKYSIYHRLHTDESPLFSIASMVEPGTFDPYTMSGVQFPGVTIFTQLPGPLPGEEMLAQMLACARELEQGIGGLLQDERGMPLTEQRAQRLREDVADFTHLLGHS